MDLTNLDQMTDEEELHKLMSAADKFEDRKRIRERLKTLREASQKEMDEKRAAHPKTDLVQDRLKAADEQKQRKLEAFADMAVKTTQSADGSSTTTTTTSVQKDGNRTTTTTVKKTESTVQKTSGIGGMQYGSKPAPKKPQSAMSAFKKMDNANNPGGAAKASNVGGGKSMKGGADQLKQALLSWCRAMTQEYENVEINNFSTAWANGLAFCALIHHFYPESFDYSKLDPRKRRDNFTLAFDTAEKYADASPLLDVEDMVIMKKPDWKCVFTYVQSLYRHLRNHERNTVAPPEQ